MPLLLGQRLTLTQIGRAINNQVAAKHNIKKLIGYFRTQDYTKNVFQFMHRSLRLFLLNVKAPVILVDWSDLTPTRSHFLLRGSFGGER